MDLSIRRLGPDDAGAYRSIRLDMLGEAPEAFSDSYEEATQRPADSWRDNLSGARAYFAAFYDGDMIGTANYLRETAAKMAHRGWLLGMYVRPQARQTGCGRALVEQVLDHARAEVIQVHVGVSANNMAARRLYEKTGFRLYGTEPRSLKVSGQYIDEHYMVRFLDKDDSDE